MVKLRLRRMGSANKPFYRLIATDSRSGTQGRFLETLGWLKSAWQTSTHSCIASARSISGGEKKKVQYLSIVCLNNLYMTI